MNMTLDRIGAVGRHGRTGTGGRERRPTERPSVTWVGVIDMTYTPSLKEQHTDVVAMLMYTFTSRLQVWIAMDSGTTCGAMWHSTA